MKIQFGPNNAWWPVGWLKFPCARDIFSLVIIAAQAPGWDWDLESVMKMDFPAIHTHMSIMHKPSSAFASTSTSSSIAKRNSCFYAICSAAAYPKCSSHCLNQMRLLGFARSICQAMRWSSRNVFRIPPWKNPFGPRRYSVLLKSVSVSL